MKLSDYIAAHDLSYAEFARMIGVTGKVTVQRYADGTRKPTEELMHRIAEATNFKVTPNDFFGVAP